MPQAARPYAGDVSPQEAWDGLASDPAAALVDVRTAAEWAFVGVADLSGVGKRPLLREWQSYPTMQVDPAFAETVARDLEAAGVGPDASVFFLCRSGARSEAAAAALAERGWRRCFNIAGGFEGPLDGERRRGSSAGWKADGLPWIQS